jgi:Sap-like sulfolipid-1-addressing protein
MLDLLAVLTPIALVDSLSMMPFAIVVLAVLLSGRQPYLTSFSFMAGTVLSYFAAGLLIAFGLGGLIDRASQFITHRFWNPEAIDYEVSLVIGLALIFFGYRMAVMRQEKGKQKEVSAEMGPGQAFVLGAGATIAGIWGALPYFAAIDQILKANVSPAESVIALVFYNLMFVSLLLLLILVRVALRQRADRMFEVINQLVAVWGKRVLIAVMVLLGLVMVADSTGYFFGHPLIPTETSLHPQIQTETVADRLASHQFGR